MFGLGPAGLFLSRQLFRRGAQVIAFCKRDDIGRYSNTLYKVFATEDILAVDRILHALAEGTEHKPKAYICSDHYLTMIVERCPSIFRLLDFSEPGEDMLRLAYDKEALMSQCTTIGVKFPKLYDATKPKKIEYPIVIKPNVKRGHSPLPKVKIVSDEEEYNAYIQMARQHGVSSKELFIQQAVSGDNRNEYGYGGYFIHGNAVTDILFRQIRQYPQGVSCHTLEVDDERIMKKVKEQVQPFLNHYRYTGFLQFDIKEDERTGLFYVLDINPRPWGSVAILGGKRKGLTVFDKPMEEPHGLLCWRFPLKEIVSSRNRNNVSYAQIRQLKKGKCIKTVLDLYDRHDLRPFLMQPYILLMKILNRKRNG